MKKVLLAFLLSIVGFLMLAAVNAAKTATADKTPQSTAAQLAEHDMHIEHDCRLQVSVSPECQAALDRLDFFRALKNSQ